MSRTYEGSLILTRREGERIYLLRENEGPIFVEIDRVKGERVRIGIHADESCLILREEVLERNNKEIYDRLLDGGVVTSEIYNTLDLKERK